MANFFDINSSQFSNKTPDGTEKIQISANQFAILKDIANLASKLNGFEITDFKADSNYAQYEKVGEFIPFKAVRALNGPTELLGSNYGSVGFMTLINNDTTNVVKSFFIILFSEQNTANSPLVVSSGTVTYSANGISVEWKPLKQDVTLTGFTPRTLMGDLPFQIDAQTTLTEAIADLYWAFGNGNVKFISGAAGGSLQADYIGMIGNNGENMWCGVLFDTSNSILYINYSMEFTSTHDLNDADIIEFIVNNPDNQFELSYIEAIPNKLNSLTFSAVASTLTTLTINGGYIYNYRPTTAKTLNLTINKFSTTRQTSMLIVPYNTSVTFSAGTSKIIIHKHQDMDSIQPTSGLKVYTFVPAVNYNEVFINCAPYT